MSHPHLIIFGIVKIYLQLPPHPKPPPGRAGFRLRRLDLQGTREGKPVICWVPVRSTGFYLDDGAVTPAMVFWVVASGNSNIFGNFHPGTLGEDDPIFEKGLRKAVSWKSGLSFIQNTSLLHQWWLQLSNMGDLLPICHRSLTMSEHSDLPSCTSTRCLSAVSVGHLPCVDENPPDQPRFSSWGFEWSSCTSDWFPFFLISVQAASVTRRSFYTHQWLHCSRESGNSWASKSVTFDGVQWFGITASFDNIGGYSICSSTSGS